MFAGPILTFIIFMDRSADRRNAKAVEKAVKSFFLLTFGCHNFTHMLRGTNQTFRPERSGVIV